MRKIKLIILIWVSVGWVTSALAQTQTLSLDFTSQSFAKPSQSLGGIAPELSDSQTTLLSYNAEDLWNGFGVNVASSFEVVDYSKYLVRSELGVESPLAASEFESKLNANLTYTKGRHQASLGGRSHLTSSPLFERGVQGAYRIGFWNQTSIIGVRAIYLVQDRPESYFIHPDNFSSQKRVEQVESEEVALSYEQIWTSFFKAFIETSTGQRHGERPRYYGLQAKFGFALTNRWFLQTGGKRYWEPDGVELTEDRGFFSLVSWKTELTYEPIYDLYLSLSYELGAELEEDPRLNREIQFGYDQIGFGISHTFSNDMNVSVQGAYALTNTESNALTMQGGLSWLL